jgi:hypothetical protein
MRRGLVTWLAELKQREATEDAGGAAGKVPDFASTLKTTISTMNKIEW